MSRSRLRMNKQVKSNNMKNCLTINRVLVAKKKLSTLLFILVVSVSAMASEGALTGRFTINAQGDQVVFSQGNLQYQASTSTWRFAENQWEVIGADNTNISPTYAGWIDLFGWATSGWDSGNIAYQPYSTSTTSSEYGLHDLWFMYNMTESYANADWGVYNAISNGGNAAGLWRTLTYDEWNYLFNRRNDASDLRSQVTVNGVHGYAILPDVFTQPAGTSFVAAANNWTANNYDCTAWQQMEAAGAVFLPAAGCRYGADQFNNFNKNGYYWTASVYNGYLKYMILFHESTATLYRFTADYGLSVRLVQVAPSSSTALDDAASNSKVVKRIVNGQLLIERDGKLYNTTGSKLK